MNAIPEPQREESARTEPAVLLVNAAARSGAEKYDALHAALKDRGVPLIHAMRVTQPGAMPRYVRAAIEGGARRLLIGGGDGTLSCAADTIVRSGADVTLGVIPLGTGNDFARGLGIPLKVEEALNLFATGTARRVDVGRLNGRTFLNAASVGLTTAIAEALTPKVKKRLGPLAYAVTAARCSLQQEGFLVRLEREGEDVLELGVVQLVVGNGAFHGGGRRVSPEASLDDGLLDVYAILAGEKRGFRPGHALSLIRVGARLNKGRHVDEKVVLQLRTKSLTVTPVPAQRANVDGEVLDAESLHFEVLPRALKVLAPA